MKCICCGGSNFIAHQLCYCDVVVDEDGNFVCNPNDDDKPEIYDSETPYGPFTCEECGAVYDELRDGEIPTEFAFAERPPRWDDFQATKKIMQRNS